MDHLLKIRNSLLTSSVVDLQREHPFAFERLGFFLCEFTGDQIIATKWFSFEDKEYQKNDYVGAEIGREGMNRLMKLAAQSNATFIQFHLHEFQEKPKFSYTDLASLRSSFIPGLFTFSEDGPHGALIKGKAEYIGAIWESNEQKCKTLKLEVTNG